MPAVRETALHRFEGDGLGRRSRPATEFEAPDFWQLSHRLDPTSDGFECLLYSDSLIHGQPYWPDSVTVGPVELIPIANEGPVGVLSGQLVVRLRHASPYWVSLGESGSNDSHYIDMYVGVELAALLSLVLGVRLRDGGLIRRFLYGRDPLGQPELHDHQAPTLIPVPERRMQFPGLRGREVLIDGAVPWLERYPRLRPAEAIALAKAARCFADALWVGDSDPQQAWLLLVTALETAAVHHQSETTDPIELLQATQPELVRLLASGGATHLLPEVAELLARSQRATRRFVDFACAYAPPPPPDRPEREERCVDWTTLRQAFTTIYGHRSAYLHEGRPLPPGMVGLNLEIGDDGRVPECPERGAVLSTGSFSWESNRIPMHLWIFAYLARGALMGWWQSLIDRQPEAGIPDQHATRNFSPS